MNDTATRIAAGLEQAFVERGFAEPNVEALRDAAGVSLRTLYKYLPSRDAMVLAALEYRHRRYLDLVFADLPQAGPAAFRAVIDRIAGWMSGEAPSGCLFHAAVSAAPNDPDLRALMQRHKTEIAERTAAAAGLRHRTTDIAVLLEGLTQGWPLYGDEATVSAHRFAHYLLEDADLAPRDG